MSDRDKFLKHEKTDLMAFCKSKSINTGQCFAKIDFVNTIIEKGYKYADFNKKKTTKPKAKPKAKPKSPAVKTSKKAQLSALSPRAKLKKTATRFCVDADIDVDAELDVAEFILAARYLGSEVNNDELMDVFMEHMEAGDDDDDDDNTKQANPKQVIKELMAKVEDKYGAYDADTDSGAITSQNTSVYGTENSGDIYSENQPENEMDEFLYKQQKEQQLEIARNLLEITALTRQEIALMTGVNADDLKQYESDEYETESESDYETESDEEEESDKKQNEKVNNNAKNEFDGVKIMGSKGKNILIEKKECDKLKRIVNNGVDAIKSQSEDTLRLLKVLSDAIDLAPGAMRRAKTMAKLNFKMSENENDKKEQEKKLFPASYRVVIVPGALCKSHKDRNEAKSWVVSRLVTGTEVIIEEIDGNRARISSPNKGWVSLKHSTNGKVILERNDMKNKSKEMTQAIKKDKMRKTQIEIVRNVTTLNEVTVVRMLEKCDWNMRVTLDSFFIAKFKTQEYAQRRNKNKNKNKNKKEKSNKRSIKTTEMFEDIDNENNKKENKGWFKKWTTFANDKQIEDK